MLEFAQFNSPSSSRPPGDLAHPLLRSPGVHCDDGIRYRGLLQVLLVRVAVFFVEHLQTLGILSVDL